MNRSKFFAAMLIALAFVITWWMMQRVPHPVTLHINNRWHVMLIGETETSSIQFNSNEFIILNEDRANLWLDGTGTINWGTRQITVDKKNIYLNRQEISTSTTDAEVHVMFYPDGRVTKGKLDLK